MAKAKTLEENMNELEQLLEQMEQDDISLEDSFKLYNNGMKLLKNCNDSIDKIEKKLILLEEE